MKLLNRLIRKELISLLPPAMAARHTDQVSIESKSAVSFDITSVESKNSGPRLARISFPGRKTIDTPHYLALSSRGTVPHLSQDMVRDNTAIHGFYVALEDCEFLDDRFPTIFNITETN